MIPVQSVHMYHILGIRITFCALQAAVRLKAQEPHARIQKRSRGSGPPPPLKITKIIGFLSNTGPDPLKYHKVTSPAFNVGPSLKIARFLWNLDTLTTHQLKKSLSELDPL